MTLALLQRLVWGPPRGPRLGQEMSVRECMILGHLLGAKQALHERDERSAQQHVDSALAALRQRSVG